MEINIRLHAKDIIVLFTIENIYDFLNQAPNYFYLLNLYLPNILLIHGLGEISLTKSRHTIKNFKTGIYNIPILLISVRKHYEDSTHNTYND